MAPSIRRIVLLIRMPMFYTVIPLDNVVDNWWLEIGQLMKNERKFWGFGERKTLK